MNSLNTDMIRRLGEEFLASFVKDLRSYSRYPAWVVGEFVSTPLWFFFFALGVTLFAPTGTSATGSGLSGSGMGYSFFYYGFIFIVLFSTGVWGIGQSVRNEQLAGTLEQFFLAPVNHVTLIIGRWLRIFLTDLLIIGYTTCIIIVLMGGGGLILVNPVLFAYSLGLYEVGLIGFGLFFAGLTMRIKSYNTISNLVFFGYMILTGALFPITIIPLPFRYVSMAIPFTYFIDLMRSAAMASSTFMPVNLEYSLATVLSVSMLVVGYVVFNKIEEDARVRGSIATN